MAKSGVAKQKRPSIKNDDAYDALRRDGASKEKAARIANTPNVGKKGGKQPSYEDWTKEALYERAQETGIDGRSKMNKDQLIDALRNN